MPTVNQIIKNTSVKPVCTECGSDDVLADAWAEWDAAAQEWVLRQTFDDYVCEVCGGECSVEWVNTSKKGGEA